MDLLIVSGMSGSGKSSVLTILEDMGFYCIDNFPIKLYETIPSLIKSGKTGNKLAITLDVRNRHSFNLIDKTFKYLDKHNVAYSLLFIDAKSEILLNRYKETRRAHPLMLNGDNDKTLEAAISEERDLLRDLQAKSDYDIDTSNLLIINLREAIKQLFDENAEGDLVVSFVSFGFKFGILADADLIYDLRCLPNPYYEKHLKDKTGNNKEVFDFVMGHDEAQKLYELIYDYLVYSIPLYIREGKSQLVVGLGCTGGKHRSVTFANKLFDEINIDNVRKTLRHRDIGK